MSPAQPVPAGPPLQTAQDAYADAAELADRWADSLDGMKSPEGKLQAEACRVVAKKIRLVAAIAARGGR